jgi:phospholipid/cholesterol/gamma-HCH transport system permease protein
MKTTILRIMHDIGGNVVFLREIIKTLFHSPCSSRSVLEQVWKISTQSFAITVVAGFFVGAILTVEFTMLAGQFSALGFLGGLATSGTVRELGPLLIAFLLSGKVGAFTSAELGTMRVTEQIDAIRCLGADPIQEIVLPRFLGIIISSFLLLVIGIIMSVAGGLLLALIFSKINLQEYFRHIPTIVRIPSILGGLFKALVFAAVLASICTYKGYTTTGGAKGVGRAVIATSVATMVGIVIADWFTSLIAETIMVLLAQGLI